MVNFCDFPEQELERNAPGPRVDQRGEAHALLEGERALRFGPERGAGDSQRVKEERFRVVPVRRNPGAIERKPRFGERVGARHGGVDP